MTSFFSKYILLLLISTTLILPTLAQMKEVNPLLRWRQSLAERSDTSRNIFIPSIQPFRRPSKTSRNCFFSPVQCQLNVKNLNRFKQIEALNNANKIQRWVNKKNIVDNFRYGKKIL
uniref:Secreted protein n=1 Tax=Rhabditophanes sp. KR3021 TaxID=114890 RepID=A0AC35THJ2_9BILA